MAEESPPRSVDLLAPAPTHAGIAAVSRAVRPARRVFLVRDSNDLVPQRLTKRRARKLLSEMTAASGPVVVTARVMGSDLVIRTMEWFGDPAAPGVPSDPAAPAGSLARARRPASPAPASKAKP